MFQFSCSPLCHALYTQFHALSQHVSNKLKNAKIMRGTVCNEQWHRQYENRKVRSLLPTLKPHKKGQETRRTFHKKQFIWLSSCSLAEHAHQSIYLLQVARAALIVEAEHMVPVFCRFSDLRPLQGKKRTRGRCLIQDTANSSLQRE